MNCRQKEERFWLDMALLAMTLVPLDKRTGVMSGCQDSWVKPYLFNRQSEEGNKNKSVA